MPQWDELPREEKLAFWAESERLLSELLAYCSHFLKPDQHEFVHEMIEHNEHGVALESLFDYLCEGPRAYPNDLLDRFRMLATRLPMSGHRTVDALRL